jgi:serine/threonine protein kinase
MADDFDGWIRGEALGEGGQAWTYLTYKKGDDGQTPFVLKVLKHKSNPARLKRFEREIEVGARLRHPNLVHVEAENIEGKKPYVVTEYCAGGELRDLDLSDIPLLNKLGLIRKVCLGVGYMHENGVIHRDLKPNNIFLREDKQTPVVGDLGLCLMAEQDERLTETTEAVGARFFMAPELEDGRYEDALPVADVYSLGKLLYWLISNKRIFSREKHKDERFNLRANQNSPPMAFVYDMLDGMIVADPRNRKYSNANEVVRAMDKMIERVEAGSHAIDPSVPQLCSYCGNGTYRQIMRGNFQTPGWEHLRAYVGIDFLNVPASWLVFACDYCGNLQMFRADLATTNPKAWEEGSQP